MLKNFKTLFRRSSSDRQHALYSQSSLQLVITDALFDNAYGQVVCLPPESMRPPFRVEWWINDEPVDAQELCTDASGLCATQVPPSEVRVLVSDSDDTRIETYGTVRTIQLPTIVQYDCRNASDVYTRDGEIRLHLEHVPETCKFLWTTGVTTTEPMLRFVSPGTYAATLLDESGDPIVFLHACCVAHVSVDAS